MNDYTKVDFNAVAKRVFPSRADLFAKSPIRLVGIRGAQEPTGAANSFARYDDNIMVMMPGRDPVQYLASTDPSWSLVVHPIVPQGAAQLLPGVHLFEAFLMHGTPRQHWCLGQAESVHINRLKDDGTVSHVDCGEFGICIHSGGEGMDTGRFSAGCQIIANPDGYFQNPTWINFWGPIRDAMIKLNLKTVPYLLVNKSDL